MNKVNMLFLDDVLSPLTGGADDDEQIDLYNGLDVNNESLIKGIILKTIKPEFSNKSLSYQIEVRKALAFALLSTNINFDRIFNRNLIAFEHPTESRDFFVWIWEILFDKQRINLEDISDYKVVEDERELMRLSMKK